MTRQSYDVAGKVVLITGGTGGIGSATARELLRRGAKVAIVDVDPDTPSIAAHMSPHSAFGAVADVRVRSILDHAVAGVVEHFGRIDVAIANAGILSRAATLRTTPASSLQSVLAVNVTGVVNRSRPRWIRSSPTKANSSSSVRCSRSSTEWEPSPTR